MESMAAVVVWTWLGGIVVAVSVMRVRSGAGFWRRLTVFGPNGFGPMWVATLTVCGMFWPITLVVWLLRGCPEPRVVFNHKADERQAARRAAGH